MSKYEYNVSQALREVGRLRLLRDISKEEMLERVRAVLKYHGFEEDEIEFLLKYEAGIGPA